MSLSYPTSGTRLIHLFKNLLEPSSLTAYRSEEKFRDGIQSSSPKNPVDTSS